MKSDSLESFDAFSESSDVMMDPAFLSPCPLRVISNNVVLCTGSPGKLRSASRMTLQRPDSDGPPTLDDYFKTQTARGTKSTTPPVVIGTGRGSVEVSNGSVKEAIETALRKVSESLEEQIDLLHVTCSPGLDIVEVERALSGCKVRCGIMGRVVKKKGDEGDIIEVLGIRSGVANGVRFAQAECPKETLETSVRNLVRSVLPKQGHTETTCWIFSHDLDVDDAAIRAIVEKEDHGRIAYGGRAVDGPVIGCKHDGSKNYSAVQVAAISGFVSFLQSAVIKSWTQPAYVDKLDFMTPKYTDNTEMDLLTAIRFNDWDKFIECMEVKKVPVNHKWVDKQSQIPLLAACARGRLEMVQYLLDHGADVEYRNDGGFNAKMYTMKLEDYGEDLVNKQLNMLKKAGANVTLTADEKKSLDASSSNKMT